MDPRIAEYQPYWAARAALLAKCGDCAGAARAYALAIGFESDPALRVYLEKQMRALPITAVTKSPPRKTPM